MPEIGSLSLNLVATVLLLVPGIVSLDLYFFASNQRPTLSRTRLVVYGSGISVLSLYLLFIASTSYMPHFGGTTDPRNFITTSKLASFSLAQVALLYVVHAALSSLLGFAVGWGNRHDGADRREPWAYAFDEAPSENEELDVTLANGQIIRGIFNEEAFDQRQRELFLDDPYKVNPETRDSSDLGRSIMIPESAISYITFSEDPNTETIRSVDVEDVEVDTELLDAIETESGQIRLDESTLQEIFDEPEEEDSG